MLNRKIVDQYTPGRERGFLGEGHIARSLLSGNFLQSDPFIFLMDDDIQKKDFSPTGGPHPHAGFETVSLLIEGKIQESAESIEKGGFQIMTAGSGIVHTETIREPTKARLFQLWLTLPTADRWAMPRLQILEADRVPSSTQDGIGIRVYSGSFGGLTSPMKNYVPLIVAEGTLEAGKAATFTIPANFNAFMAVISGSIEVGLEKQMLNTDEVGWLNHIDEDEPSELQLQGGSQDARIVIYAGEPQRTGIISHGPFIAEKEDQIQKLYKDYRLGIMKHIAASPKAQRITY